jgi:hypothetical protein
MVTGAGRTYDVEGFCQDMSGNLYTLTEETTFTATENDAKVLVVELLLNDPNLDVVEDNDLWMLMSCAIGETLAFKPS